MFANAALHNILQSRKRLHSSTCPPKASLMCFVQEKRPTLVPKSTVQPPSCVSLLKSKNYVSYRYLALFRSSICSKIPFRFIFQLPCSLKDTTSMSRSAPPPKGIAEHEGLLFHLNSGLLVNTVLVNSMWTFSSQQLSKTVPKTFGVLTEIFVQAGWRSNLPLACIHLFHSLGKLTDRCNKIWRLIIQQAQSSSWNFCGL